MWNLLRLASLPGRPATNSPSPFILKVCRCCVCDDAIHRKQEVSTSSQRTRVGSQDGQNDESREAPAAGHVTISLLWIGGRPD